MGLDAPSLAAFAGWRRISPDPGDHRAAESSDHTGSRHRRVRILRWPIPIVAFIAFSCQSGDLPRDGVYHPTPPNIPENPSLIVTDSIPPGLAPAVLDRWQAAREDFLSAPTRFRIGSSADGPELFGRVVDATFDSSGNLLVLDQQASEIRVFAFDGRHSQTFGGFGEGPAEFRNATAIVPLSGGRVLILGTPRRGKLFKYMSKGYDIFAPLDVMVDLPDAACSNNADQVFVAGGTGDQLSAIHRIDPTTGRLLGHVGDGYLFDDWAVRGIVATGTVACLDIPPSESRVFYSSKYLPFIKAYSPIDDSVVWVAQVDEFLQTPLHTPPGGEGGIGVFNHLLRDEVFTIQSLSPTHLLVQTGRLDPMASDPSLVRTYLVDVDTGFGALISDDLGLVVAVSGQAYAVLRMDPFPQVEVRDR